MSSPDEARLPLNPNRVVAHNLRRARLLRGMTQEQAAAALEPYLGVRWKKQTISMAEKATRQRPRRFDAAEIAAFAQVFDLPIAWFFMPPRVPRTRKDYEIGWPIRQMEIAWNMRGEPAVAVVDLVDAALRQAQLRERRDEIIQGPLGYRGLLDELAARRQQRDRVRALDESEEES